jgi:hypothetical protein
MDHPKPTSRLLDDRACGHLRHKGMYVMSEPDLSMPFDPHTGTAYWCCCTQMAFGPDGDPVRPDLCGPDRECCEH